MSVPNYHFFTTINKFAFNIFPISHQRVRSSCSFCHYISHLIGCCLAGYFTCEMIDSSYHFNDQLLYKRGCLALSVTCLIADICLVAEPGVASLIPARPHTFMEIDCEIISTAILLPSADSRRVVVSYK